MNNIGYCKYCNHVNVDMAAEPCKSCNFTRGNFELSDSEYDRGFDDGYNKACTTFELEYYQGHTLGEAYQEGKTDAIDELYSHRLNEIEDENDSIVCIQKAWFEKLKGDKE